MYLRSTEHILTSGPSVYIQIYKYLSLSLYAYIFVYSYIHVCTYMFIYVYRLMYFYSCLPSSSFKKTYYPLFGAWKKNTRYDSKNTRDIMMKAAFHPMDEGECGICGVVRKIDDSQWAKIGACFAQGGCSYPLVVGCFCKWLSSWSQSVYEKGTRDLFIIVAPLLLRSLIHQANSVVWKYETFEIRGLIGWYLCLTLCIHLRTEHLLCF